MNIGTFNNSVNNNANSILTSNIYKNYINKDDNTISSKKTFANIYESQISAEQYQNLSDYEQIIHAGNTQLNTLKNSFMNRDYSYPWDHTYYTFTFANLLLEEIPSKESLLSLTRDEFTGIMDKIKTNFSNMNHSEKYKEFEQDWHNAYIKGRLEYTGCKDEKELEIFNKLVTSVDGLYHIDTREELEYHIYVQAASGYNAVFQAVYPPNGQVQYIDDPRFPNISETLSQLSMEELAQWNFIEEKNTYDYSSVDSLKSLKSFISGTILTSDNLSIDLKANWGEFYNLSEQYADQILAKCEEIDSQMYEDLLENEHEKQEKNNEKTIQEKTNNYNIINFNQQKINQYIA